MKNGWFAFWCIICAILMICALVSVPILYGFGLASYIPLCLIVFYDVVLGFMILMLDTSNNYNKQIKENKKMNYENEINNIYRELGRISGNLWGEIIRLEERINELNKKNDMIDTLAYNSNILNRYDNGGKGFKVGDRVQFKTWEEMEKEFELNSRGNIEMGGVRFKQEMRHLCGTYATIKRINGINVELCDFTSSGNIFPWWYTLDMLKHAENEPKWVFTEDEKAILRNVDSKYKYLVRDKSNELWIHGEKPKKVYTCNCWATSWNGVTYLSNIFEFSNIFKCIQWTDEEPCEFRKYI